MAFHEAASEETAGADGDEGLDHVEAFALRIGFGVHEGEHAFAAEADAEEEVSEDGDGGYTDDGVVLPVESCDVEDDGSGADADECGAEVRLFEDERAYESQNECERGESAAEILQVTHTDPGEVCETTAEDRRDE